MQSGNYYLYVNMEGKNYDATWAGSEILLFSRELNPGKGDYQLFYATFSTNRQTPDKVVQLTDGSGSIRHPDWTGP